MKIDMQQWTYARLTDVRRIPERWRLVTLIEEAKLESGHTPDRDIPAYWQGDIPWLSLHDTKQLDSHVVVDTRLHVSELGIANSSARLLPAGTVALSRTATVGKCVILGRSMATSQDFACYICGPRVHNKYLMHLFRYMQPVWRSLAGGSTHQTVYMPVFKRLEVLLPTLEEQRKIAEILDTVDESIRSTERLIAKRVASHMGLLAVLIDPAHEPEADVAQVVSSCEEIFKLSSGRPPEDRSAVRDIEKEFPIYGGNGVNGYTDRPMTSGQTLVIGRVGENCGAVEYSNSPIWVTDNALWASKFHADWLPKFVFRCLQRFDLRRLQSRTGQPLVTQRQISRVLLRRPSKIEQDKICAILDDSERVIGQEEEHLAKVRKIKQGLMEDLLTGRVRVKVD